MTQVESVQLEPFAEPAGSAYRFGYRVAGTANVVLAVEMPAVVVEPAVMMGASISVRIDADGLVISRLLVPNVVDGSELPCQSMPLDHLVQEIVDIENLRVEESTADDLKILLHRLERSVAFVSEAINQIATASEA